MKTLFFALVAFSVSVVAAGEQDPLVFRSVTTIGGKSIFSVTTAEKAGSAWVSVGDHFEGYQIDEFIRAENVLVVSNKGQQWRVFLAHAAPIAALRDIPSAETVEDVLRSLEGLPLDVKGELLLHQSLAEFARFTQTVETAGSADEVVATLNEHKRKIDLLEPALDQALDAGWTPELREIVLARLPDLKVTPQRFFKTYDDLRSGKYYGADERVQMILKNIDAERNERASQRRASQAAKP